MADLTVSDNPEETIRNLQSELQQNKDWLREANERILKLMEVARDAPIYELQPIAPGSVCSRFDGLPDVFLFHESLDFRDFNGYDSSVLHSWALGSVSRAFGLDDMGRPLPGDLGNRCGDLGQQVVQENGTTKIIPPTPCTHLPPFDKRLRLEVIVQVLPIDAVDRDEAVAV